MMTPLSAQGTLQRTRDYISYYLPQLYQRVRVCAPVRVNTYVCFSVCAHTHAHTHALYDFDAKIGKMHFRQKHERAWQTSKKKKKKEK